MSQAEESSPFIRQWQHFISDSVFTRLFPPTRFSRLRLWMAIETDGTANLLYGQVSAFGGENASRWSGSQKCEIRDAVLARCEQFNLVETNEHVLLILSHLAQGETLATACTSVGLMSPPEEIVEYRLGDSANQVAEWYSLLPLALVPPRSMATSTTGPTSPAENVGAFIGGLVPRRVLPWLSGDSGVIRQLVTYVAERSGLDCRGADAGRLGAIEWVAVAATTPQEAVGVRLETESPNVARITISDTVLPDTGKLWVRCRCMMDGMALTDEGQEVLVSQKTCAFTIPTRVSETVITIWHRETVGEPWRLWFEGRWSFILGVGLTLAIAGSRATVASKWLNIHAPKHPDVMARAKRASEVHAVRHLAPTPIVTDDLRWLQTRRTVQDEVRRAFPPPSPGRFFAKGWRANGPGQLAFVEWFLDLTSRPGTGTMWIIDPYFDTAGVVELLGKSRATQRIYRVLTNTQIPSDDDALDPTSTSRAKRLVQACLSSQLLLGQLDFELWDLQSANKKLHDRYILIYGGNDRPEEGYHLSNSLQYATENTPLLITPIPSDILGDVVEYVQNLLRDSSDTRCVLFTSRVTQTQHRENLTSGYNASPFLFSVWLEDRCLRHASPAKVLEQLSSRGLANPWNVSQLRKHIGALARGLASADSSKFRPLWSAFAEWLAHVPTKDVSACLDDLMQLRGNDISPKLVNFLNQAFSDVSAYSIEPDRLALEIYHLFRADFKEVVATLYGFPAGWPLFPQALWTEQFAVEALFSHRREALFMQVAEWYEVAKRGSWVDNEPRTQRAAACVTAAVFRIYHQLRLQPQDDLLQTMLKSQVPFLRALVAWHYIDRTADGTEVPKALSALKTTLSSGELYRVVRQWLRRQFRADRADPIWAPATDALWRELCAVWDHSGANLEETVKFLSGSDRDHCTVVQEHLTLPLTAEGSISAEEAASVWVAWFFEGMVEAFAEARSIPNLPGFRSLCCLAGSSLMQLSHVEFDKAMNHLSVLKNRCERKLFEPWSRVSGSRDWQAARDNLLWLYAFACAAKRETDTTNRMRLDAVSQLVEVLSPVMKYISRDEYERPFVQWLHAITIDESVIALS